MNPFQGRALILASRSPRRAQLLADSGLAFDVCPADDAVEEPYDPARFASPAAYVLAQSRVKAQDAARHFPGQDLVILACDTVAVCGGEILGKPTDRADARRMLRALAGSTHDVLSGLTLLNPAFPERAWSETVSTTLRMDALTPATIEAYLDGGKWVGKAGAFGFQDGNDWLHIVSGTASNVVGLPIERVLALVGIGEA